MMKKIIFFILFSFLISRTFTAQFELLGLALKGDEPGIIALLKRNPLTNINVTIPPHLDHGGNTALHFLATHQPTEDNLKAITALKDAGANIHAQNKEGKTPANLATDPTIKATLSA